MSVSGPLACVASWTHFSLRQGVALDCVLYAMDCMEATKVPTLSFVIPTFGILSISLDEFTNVASVIGDILHKIPVSPLADEHKTCVKLICTNLLVAEVKAQGLYSTMPEGLARLRIEAPSVREGRTL